MVKYFKNVLVLGGLGFLGFVILCQLVWFSALFFFHASIFFTAMPEQPRILLTESSDPTNLLFWKAVDIEYFVDGNKRTAYYFPPKSGLDVPKCLWIMVHSKRNLIAEGADVDSGFLFIDLDGASKSVNDSEVPDEDDILSILQMTSSISRSLKENNIATIEQAYNALKQYLSDVSDSKSPVSVGGFSPDIRGSFGLLELSEKYKLDSLVFLNPYTSFNKEIEVTWSAWPFLGVGYIYGLLVPDQYDIENKLATLANHPFRPRVVLVNEPSILTVDQDPEVFTKMAIKMAKQNPGYVTYYHHHQSNHELIIPQVIGNVCPGR